MPSPIKSQFFLRSSQGRRAREPDAPAALEQLEAMRDRIDRRSVRPSAVLPLSEPEQRVLFRVMPDRVVRIALEEDGVVWVISPQSRLQISARSGPQTGGEDIGAGQAASPFRALDEEIARHAQKLMADFLETGEVQVLELQLEREGWAESFEVRAAASQRRELIAVVRDVTSLKKAEDGRARSAEELDRLKEVMHAEACLRDQEEAIIRSSRAKLHDLLEDTIGAIAMIVKEKDPDTARHQERVCQLACAMGREMGLDPSQVNLIGLASLLHDLGKVLVPSRILGKTDRLTEAEMAAFRSHAETEFEILRSIEVLAPLAEVVHQHHERLDGSGYPRGSGGDAVQLEARVLAVADVVEAMLSDRPHRPALEIGQVLEEISRGKGALSDGRVVDACIRLFEERGFSFDEAESAHCFRTVAEQGAVSPSPQDDEPKEHGAHLADEAHDAHEAHFESQEYGMDV